MSTRDYTVNDVTYKIGTIGWEGPKNFSQLPGSTLPTYGLWAGPGWSGNERPLTNDTINWATEPCRNSLIEGQPNPDEYFSLLDVVCREHDWNYYQAEKNGNNRETIAEADKELLKDIAAVAGATSYTSPQGVYKADGTWDTWTFAGTFDSTEASYTTLLVPAFTIKLGLWDTPLSIFSEAIEAFNTIWSIVGTPETTYADPSDPSKKIQVTDSNGIIIYESEEGTTDVGWSLDPSAEKAYNVATIDYGENSAREEDTFISNSGGLFIINGGTGDDKITTGENEINETHFEIAGGGGYDTYYLTDGDSFLLTDSGANRIYKEDESGGWLSAGNFYKEAADVAWRSADGGEQFSQGTSWTITFEDESTVELGADFQSGDFGITLLEIPDISTITNMIVGTSENNLLQDTGGNDRLMGLEGRDRISAVNGGMNIVEGGAGADIIEAGPGDDQIFGESYADRETLIAQGETAGGINQQGDLEAGGAGNDFIYGTNSNDLLEGGMGNDLIVAGGGDDVVVEDAIFDGATADWSTTINTVMQDDGFPSFTLTGNGTGWIVNQPGAGNDVIYTGTGNDYVIAGGGDDEIYAGTDNDTVFGEGGNDFIEGGAGNDVLGGDNAPDFLAFSEHGNDYIDGGAGDDKIRGGGGSDELFGGDGNDLIHGDYNYLEGAGDDYIDGEAGNDSLYGLAGDDVIFGGDGNDLLDGDYGSLYDGDDYLDGEAGDDTLYGQGGNDIVFGGDGVDLLYGNLGDDYLDGGAGNDTLIGAEGSDELYGGDGNDGLAGDAANVDVSAQGDDYLDGGAGNDSLIGYAGNDTLDGGADNDHLWGGTGDDELYGSEGSDTITGDDGDGTSSGADYLDGGAGDDNLYGEGGNDTIFGGDGNDQIDGDNGLVGAGDDYIDGEAGADILVGGAGNDTIYGGDDNDQIDVGTGNNYIDGGIGDDIIVAADGNDAIYGSDGADQIWSGAGNDTLSGGAGNDSLTGATGNDTYLFGRGSGQDTIYDQDATVGNIDTILFDSDILPADVVIRKSGAHLVISITGTTDTLVVYNGFEVTGAYQVEQIQFADATTWDMAAIKNIAVQGTEGNDVIYGFNTPDAMNGNGGNDVLYGYDGNDTLDGGAGDDYYMRGGGGDDLIYGGIGNDSLYGDEGNNSMFGGEGDDQLFAGNSSGNDMLDGGPGNDSLIGDGGFDTLIGGDGNDVLSAYDDPTTMMGGLGDDQYSTTNNIDVIIIEYANEGHDIVISIADNYTLPANIEDLQLYTYGGINGTGNDLDNIITGNYCDNYLSGGAGNDTLDGMDGQDTLDGGTGNDYLTSTDSNWSEYWGADTFMFGRGYDQDVISNHNVGANQDVVLLGNDILPSDIRLTKEGDNLVLSIIGTTDTLTIVDWFSYTASQVQQIQFADSTVWDTDYIELNAIPVGTEGNDFLVGTSGSDILEGLGGNDQLYGFDGDDTLNGGTGEDGMYGGLGNDIYIVDNTYDYVAENIDEGTDTVQSSITYTLGANVENLTLTGTSSINGTGNTLANVLTGNSAANTLSGGTGADTMIGGAGDDTYIVDNTSDVVTENANEGTDMVQSAATFTLTNNVENLTLGGSSAISGTGNTLDNILIGNTAANTLTGGAGNDTLNGGAGRDTMRGGAGNDTYIVDNTSDVVTENASEGTDTIQSTVTYTLGSNVEDLTLTGASAINGTGNTLANILTGNSAANTLSGGAGADTMIGGAGNDTYIVDNTGDVVTENAGEGTDAVQSSVTYTLGSNVENLTLTGTTAINGTGNTLDNILTGNSAANTLTGDAGNDTLNGGAGNDTMRGGAGNDTYVVANTGDVVTENASEGTDTVQSSITYTVGSNVENLTLTGTSAINATGNTLDNVLTGNSAANTLTGDAGNDTLDGGTGNDTMRGGAGNDTYVVANTGDVVTENANEGTDTVQSSITYTVGSNVENLTLTGTSAINGTGNTLDNALIGNGVVNTLTGDAGNDTLDGGAGNDSLVGGTGSDTYLFRRADGMDTISDYSTQEGDSDTVRMTDGIQTSEPVIVKQDNDLYFFIDVNNYMKVASQFQSSSYGVERLEVTDGHYITRQDIENIINTMSSINNDPGMDVIQKFNAMQQDQTYISTLASSWHQA